MFSLRPPPPLLTSLGLHKKKYRRHSPRLAMSLTGIVETDDIQSILMYLNADTDYILDLDETTVRHPRSLGGRRWGDEYMRQLIAQGKNRQMALEEMLEVFNALQEHTSVVPMEDSTVAVIQKINEHARSSLALTARSEENRSATERHLRELSINFKYGILFADGRKNKPACLKIRLEQLKKQNNLPKNIVYVDDLSSSVEEIKEVVESFGIKFYGFHYFRALEYEKDFDYSIAEKQRELFDLGKGPLHDDDFIKQLLAEQNPRPRPRPFG